MTRENATYNLPEGWTFASIEDIIGASGVFKDGDWIESKDQSPNGKIRLIQLADIGDGNFRDRSNRFMTYERAIELNCTFLQFGDILIARMPDPLGRATIFPYLEKDKYVTVVDVAIVRTAEGINNKYLMNCLNSPFIRLQINSLETGTTRKRISRGNLAKIKIPVPPVQEQHAIVERIEELISELDNSVSSLKLAENQLKLFRQVLLNDSFEGKRTKNWRATNNGKTADDLLSDIEVERQKMEQIELENWRENINKWEKSESKTKKPIQPKKRKTLAITGGELDKLPVLPEGWAYTKIANVSVVGTGITPLKSRTDYYQQGIIPWVTSGALNEWFIKEPSDYITEVALIENHINVYPKHTLLIALYGEGKTRGKCSELLFDSATNQAIAAIVQTGLEQTLRTYLKWFLLKNYMQLRELASGGAQQNLNLSIIENTIFPVASLEEIKIIVEDLDLNFSIVEHLEAMIAKNLHQSEILRQKILDDAVKGKLIAQNPIHEPAVDFINHLKEQKAKDPSEKKTTPTKRNKAVMKNANKTILEVLSDSKKPMSAEDVWKQSKHRDNIEEFYAELKKVQNSVIEIKKGILSLSK